jgi:hypothetical protein
MRGPRALHTITIALALGVVCACGGSTPPSETPEDVEQEPIAETEPPPEPKEPTPEEGTEGDEGETQKAAVEPEFKDGMTVEEAINAVPQGTQRENVEQDALSKPLLDSKLYEPCKPKPNQKFRVKVAVWAGRAVGIDVDATPKNDALVDCVKQQVSQVQWKDKVKSLNTVEFNF